MKAINTKIIILLAGLSLIWWSCKKDDANPSPSPGPSSEKTTITGRVTDAAGNPLSGVSIKAGDKSATTSANGIFTLSSVDASSGRVLVKGSKAGYFDGIRGLIPEKSGITKLELIMPASTADFNGNTSQNADFISDGSGIEIPANSLTGSSGNFSAAIEHISPDDPDFERMVPGGDLLASDASGNDRQLFSYGMLMVKLSDASGNEINLASGKTATVRMKIASSQLATAPASIPLWHLDEATGKWKEEGSATRQGDQYVGTVSHFSSWNCDEPGDRATIKGIVKDCKGKPMEGVRVRIGQTSAFTDASGAYESFVPSGIPFNVAVEAPELGISSSPVSVNPLTSGSTQTIPDISVSCVSAVAFLLSCSNGTLGNIYFNIQWGNNQSVFGTLNGSGKKYLPVPSNGQQASYTFTNVLSGKMVTGSFTLPSQLDTLDKGTLNLCGDSTSSNNLPVSMTLNGDGFVNQQIQWSGVPLTASLIYSPADSASVVFSGGSNGFGLSMFFGGNPGPGQHTLDDGATVTVSAPGGKNYTSDSLLVINITEYGAVGQKVKGTFSGRFIRVEFDTANQQVFTYPITVSSGSFEVVRRPDQ